MFTLTISCLTSSSLPWFMNLIFQVPMQYCSLQYPTLLSSPDTSTIKGDFCFGPAASFFLELLLIVLHSSPVAYWHLLTWGSHLSVLYLFAFLYSSWHSHGQNTEVICHALLQWTMFCQNSPLWPIHLGWPCMACLIASLSYASPFARTRQWSIKGKYTLQGIK